MTDTLQPRKAALSVLHHMRKGEDSTAALDAVLGASAMDRRDKAFAMLLAMGCLRYYAPANAILSEVMQKPIDEKKAAYVADILRLGVVQMLWLNVPSHAAVHSSVELVKRSKFRGFAKLVNGVLQRVNREGQELLQSHNVAKLVTPTWLWQRWEKNYGSVVTQAIAEANLQEPKLDITVKSNPQHWAEELKGSVLPTGSIRLHENALIKEMSGYADGEWWVQDIAAALPIRLLGDIKGKRVLDLCAAPGGKTAQMAMAGAQVTAVDRSSKRVQRLNENLSRLQISSQVNVETQNILQWQPEEKWDAILLDAPCTATGTLRRHPDIAQNKRDKDVLELAALQRTMLLRAMQWLKPNGILVFSTCSLEPEEGEDHVLPMLAAQAELVPVQADEIGGLGELITPEGYLRCLPHYLQDIGGMDGFFAARFMCK